MAKGKSIMTVVFLCLLSGIGVNTYAQPPKISSVDLKENMQRHIEKVKIKSPQKYQTMVQRAGGNITDCLSCHVEVAEGHKFPAKGKIEGTPVQ